VRCRKRQFERLSWPYREGLRMAGGTELGFGKLIQLYKKHCNSGWHSHHSLQVLEVAFTDGQRFTFAAELLRAESPSADNQRKDNTGARRLVSGRKYVCILRVESIGNYAVRIVFDDLHENGIFTWNFLYDLGTTKYSRSKAYIKQLRESGLSREPKRKPA
jgi:DUF971 family protein